MALDGVDVFDLAHQPAEGADLSLQDDQGMEGMGKGGLSASTSR